MREDPHAWEFACGDLQNARIAAWETAKSVASDSFPHTEPCKHLIEALDPRDSCELLNHRIDLLCCVVDHLESDVAQADALDLQCWAENESMDLRSDLMTELETLGYSSSDIDSELDLIISQAKALTGSRIARHVDDPIPEPDSKKEAISAWRMRREQERMEREESQKRERAALLTQRRKSDALQATKKQMVLEFRRTRDLVQQEQRTKEEKIKRQERAARQRKCRQVRRTAHPDPSSPAPLNVAASLTLVRESTAALLRRFKAISDQQSLLYRKY